MQQSLSLIERPRILNNVIQCLDEAPVTVMLGARQTGKTTLAHMVAQKVEHMKDSGFHFFDLERAASRSALSTPEITLENLKGLIVIDEIQRMPSLFEVLRPLADRHDTPAHFLVLGSASLDIVRGVSESLAGRSFFLSVSGFTLDEVGLVEQDKLWLRGGFPRSWLAATDRASFRWRESFVGTFLERDIPQLGIRIPAETLRRFWMMLTHYHGQIWNASELARSLSASSKTILNYRDTLAGGYVIRILPPWYENLKKRQVKSPKVYIRDCGLLHCLLGIDRMEELRSHPQYGASWEGFALEQILSIFGSTNAYFWSTQRGAELDLLLFSKGRRWGFEFKCSDAPSMTKSIHIALQDLSLEKIFVVYPGKEQYKIHERVVVMPLSSCLNTHILTTS